MKIVMWIVGIVLAIGLGAVIFLSYMGLFSTMKVEQKEMGPYTTAYESFTGEYKETGKIFTKVYEQLKKDGIETTYGIGIYYDDPRQVSKDQLRSDCGCVINPPDMDRLETVKDKYQIKTLEKRLSLVTEFPIRNSLSYMIGPMKAYSALAADAEKQGQTIDIPYEFYDMEAKKIYFVAPLIEQ